MPAEEWLRLILRNITDYAIFTIDPQGYVTNWLEGAERVKGWKADEIIGQHVSTFYTPEQVASGMVEAELREATEHGRAEREDWRVRKGGERFWGNEIATAMHDASGRLVGFTKIARDLSDRKRIEDDLRDSEERHRLIVENARDYAIFLVDRQGRVMTWNTGAQRIFGYADNEIVGRDAAVLFTPEDRAKGENQKELATAAADGRAGDDRWQMRKGGEQFFASGITTALRDAAGMLRGFVKICRDLTEQRMMQEERERLFTQEKVARLAAERAMAIRDEFLAVVSHELRTPLTAILLWTKMLRAGMLSPQDSDRAIRTIEQSAESQRQLVEDLLDVSSMMSGKMRLKVREADIAAVVQAAVEAVRPMAEAKGIRLDVNFEPQPSPIRIDPDRIQQVVWNLVNNAVKFSGDGSSVSVTLQRINGFVELRVRDTGRGITAEFLPYVFERFRQADATPTRSIGGLGLGLAICRQIVELHAGSIRAESTGENKGSLFTVQLPAKLAHLEADGHGLVHANDGEVISTAPVKDLPGLRELRALVVEDDGNARNALRVLFERHQSHVTAVDSAALAVAAFRESLSRQRYDVLVSDIGMPVQDGHQLLREIRQMERQRGELRPLPALALTAYAREEDRAKALSAGFQEHLPKPIDPDLLLSAVVRLSGRGEAEIKIFGL